MISLEKNVINEIELVLDKDVRPELRKHFGDLQVLSYENNIIKIKLIGQCSNCPSANNTVENLIEDALKKQIPEIEQVVLIQGVSDELIEFAKEILKHRKQ